MNRKIKEALEGSVKEERLNSFKIGDGVRVHLRVREGDKERIQTFPGIVIARKGTGPTETFTVRRISFGQGVEKIFPIHSPTIEKIEVERHSVILRAKLYYMRKRIGKKAMQVKEKAYSGSSK
ncbi:MAG: 50S ribosomal protein L19 [Puniceicoccales bacterium]|jgi:large subunit ribosomal protein L19|nr:50S ribosomal protein L19 [Puniceicoccales bacterium]